MNSKRLRTEFECHDRPNWRAGILVASETTQTVNCDQRLWRTQLQKRPNNLHRKHRFLCGYSFRIELFRRQQLGGVAFPALIEVKGGDLNATNL